MNVKELIEKYKRYEGKWNSKTGELARQIFLEDLKQLDEPRKVKVPQFVADWIEEKRDMGWKLTKMVLQANLNEQYWRWVVDNQETFARAWLDGYEVEKEKRYLVKIKATKHYFNKDGNGRVYFSLAYKSHFTKKQLEEADFGWVFDCEGIEIEEVE
ncbi:DUF1642 domain-containing protein [Streptococcus mitis]|uniref:Phage protein n=1 Tax=Streptococcus mitis TaxID=28037 RepID=A0A3R9J842_STRMT|nr:DUF1642 domain-containing protein [Streptococcus mitis]RSJ12907.1 hypothetical protein D8836_05565 [Streptococcus mitis]